MKKTIRFISALMGVFVLGAGMAFGQISLAEDNASNYGGSWSNGVNQGYGFGSWSIASGGGSGGFGGVFFGCGVLFGYGVFCVFFGFFVSFNFSFS